MALTDAADAPGALYNRYRPRRLADLVGQEHVTVPLQRAFEKGRIHHAYLLSGSRGCGKTSTARILAAGLVCENGPTANPCNECVQCTSVIKGNHIDVIELDAASNGGVDDARELREKAHYSPGMARFKVIVVDEAHMVSAAGFNALLKLIEEPPPHVRFIFATTNPEKVLGTIRSRTYHYGFRLVPAPALAAHVEAVVASEGATLEEGVLPLIVRAGGGSMRDSLAVLGQLLDGSDEGTVRLSEAAALLGATSDTILDRVLDALAARDTATLLVTVAEAVDNGADPRRFTEDLLDRLRDLLLLATTGALPPLAEVAGAERQSMWRSVADRLTTRGLTIACETLQAAVASPSPQPRITLEVALARTLLDLADSVDVNGALHALTQQVAALAHGVVPATPVSAPAAPVATATPPAQTSGPSPTVAPAPPVEPSPDALLAPLGEQVERHDHPTAAAPTPTPHQTVPVPAAADPAPAPTSPTPVAGVGPGDWDAVLVRVKAQRMPTWALLNQHAQVTHLGDGRIVLTVPSVGLAETVRGRHADVLAAAASEALGGTWTVDVQAAA